MLIIQSQNLHNFAGTIINFACGLLLIGDSVKNKNTALLRCHFLIGGPGRIRTCDLLIRSQTLYPAELRSHVSALSLLTNDIILVIGAHVNTIFKIFSKKFFIPPRREAAKHAICF